VSGPIDRPTSAAHGWDEAADGYDAYFVPRFAPWHDAAVRALVASRLPPGPILVPCCGTFPELDPLRRHLPGREFVGIDLSAGMIRRARLRSADHPAVHLVVADAQAIGPGQHGRYAGVLSVFGLQQLPDPPRAVRAWLDALAPGGRLSVVFWPRDTETDGPFALLSGILDGHTPAPTSRWEDTLASTITEHGGVVERDERLAYPIAHPDAGVFFDRYLHAGPLRALATARGDAYVERLRTEFLRRAPAGAWTHHPAARLIVARPTATSPHP
jgi:SAM-dependent methyltransferase